jgi:phospholipase/lecithinase/hemolysin
MRRCDLSKSRWMAVGVLAAGLWLNPPAHGDAITGIVSFGDSLSDVGNYYAATNGLSPPTAFGYAPGLFTNGSNWVQYLAKDLGVAAPTASSSGGMDYAYGGAMTGTGDTSSTFVTATGSVTVSVPNIGQQISTYLSEHTPTPSQLYTIWGGANDILNGNSSNPTALLTSVLGNIKDDIATLAAAGAKQFLVGNLPPLNLIPAGLASTPAQQAGLAQFSVAFNQGLQSEATALQQALGVQIHILDVYSLFNSVIADPAKYGFTNVTSPALTNGSNGQGYLFWDTVHPTTQADRYVGALGAQTVPEPSSWLLFAVALTAVGGWARCRRAPSQPTASQ